MTVHVIVPVEDAAKADLEAWADARGVSLDTVLAEAVGAFVADQRDIQAAIDKGRADVAAGRILSHEDVRAALEARREAWAPPA